MAQTKLTLRLNKTVIERGKAFAKQQGTSLSKLFENFLLEVTPVVRKEPIAIEPDEDVLALMIPRKNRESFAGNPDELHDYYDFVSTNHLNDEEE